MLCSERGKYRNGSFLCGASLIGADEEARSAVTTKMAELRPMIS